MNIVILDAETLSLNNDIDFSAFDQYGNVKIYGSTGENQIVERISEADVVLCNKTPLFEKTLCKATKLKYIGLFATGYNNVDLEYTRKKGIKMCIRDRFIGDQIFTDIWGANRTGIETVMLKQIDKKEEIQIILKRIPEKLILWLWKRKVRK